MSHLLKKAIAEAAGTFALVFFACGTAIMTGGNVVATSLAFGLVIVAMVFFIGNISGCHINPAVSIAMLLSKKMTTKEFFVYIGAQFAGAILGATLLYTITVMTGMSQLGWATNRIATFDNSAAGLVAGYIGSFLFEIVLTFAFVFFILVVTSRPKNAKFSGITIGFALVLVHLIGIGLTGTSVNPARSFGPALMSLIFGGQTAPIIAVWVFLIAPMVGGVLAALLFKVFPGKKALEEEAETTEEKAEIAE